VKYYGRFELWATSVLLCALMMPSMDCNGQNLKKTGRAQYGETAFGDTDLNTITTVVSEHQCSSFSKSCTGGVGEDGGPAISAWLYGPRGVFVNVLGDLLIVDTFSHRIKQVDHATGTITTVAGNNHCYRNQCDGSFSGDGGPATAAELNNPRAVVADSGGNIFISDMNNNRIRRVDKKTGVISTIVGTVRGFSGDGGPATEAELNNPLGIALDASENLFIADSSNGVVRRVDHATGIITTVAGKGRGVSSGDGGPATSAGLSQPLALYVDNFGNLLITTGDHRVRRVDLSTGIITTVVGKERGFSGDGGPAIDALITNAEAIVGDSLGNLFIADTGNWRVRRIDHATGIITTVVGDGISGYKGDGGPATNAELTLVMGLAIDGAGNLFIADSNNNRIRRAQMAHIKHLQTKGAAKTEQ